MGVKLSKTKPVKSSDTSAVVDGLPVEILQQMLSYVPARDVVLNCSRVCKQWHELVNDVVYWRRRCDAAAVVYPTNTSKHNDDSLLDFRRLYFFRPFCRNLVKNWNAAG